MNRDGNTSSGVCCGVGCGISSTLGVDVKGAGAVGVDVDGAGTVGGGSGDVIDPSAGGEGGGVVSVILGVSGSSSGDVGAGSWTGCTDAGSPS